MYTKMGFVHTGSCLLKKAMHMVMGLLLIGAAAVMVSPTASAHQPNEHLSWWTNSEYNMEYLVVDYVTTGVPFDMFYDQGYCFRDRCYAFYHRYFVYEGPYFHTFYYYIYRE